MRPRTRTKEESSGGGGRDAMLAASCSAASFVRCLESKVLANGACLFWWTRIRDKNSQSPS